ncbi:nuclease [Carbonactinospora thermoautotrophica]|uniref:Nuclease n=1 Tax=Carbonactinospora thermoautotrophica TaxID=1469144 RepID=A0A132MJB7_9ACTN|nr:NERD domain-containing protein/DEAD/DEAH box helicase [Carbonactinospora thermoautotrophica]KWW97918.1 nuclease [Carbonactinospora thermoautotrophica]KWX06186.1 nuclease [Carbonactinospora thermoautotrophica]
MARMIPPLIGDDAAPGERLVFQRLASDPASEGWTVLHSLDLAKHVRQVQGEADFVVIAPGRGVAIIEIKSHERVARGEDGQWLLGNKPPTPRSPFQQASGAMHTILAYLRGKRIDLRGIPVVYGVWFTHVRARAILPPSPEWHSWQLLDRDDFRTGAARAVLRLLDKGREHLAKHIPAMASTTPGPDETTAKALVAALRPRFELGAGSADLRRNRNAQLSAFLREQYEALDAMEGNPRVLFTGPAGSGKTFLAFEAARREAATGKSGWLLCYNRALGTYLRDHSSGAPGLEAGSLHSIMLRITGLQPPEGANSDFWQVNLVEASLERLLDGDLARDYLIVDEIQDLSAPGYLDVLDLMVKGGLAGGRCLLFGDFERQALYGLHDGRNELATRIPGLVSYTLTANCRNLPRIGAAVELLSGMSPGYRKFRRQDDGVQPRYYWYSNPDEQGQLLSRAVRELRDEGFELEEIVILSPRRSRSAATQCKDQWLRPLLAEAKGTVAPKGRVRYTTIHAFKGLEAPAVIVTDIDDPSVPGFEALLYTGLTRPTDRLSVLATKDALAKKLL